MTSDPKDYIYEWKNVETRAVARFLVTDPEAFSRWSGLLALGDDNVAKAINEKLLEAAKSVTANTVIFPLAWLAVQRVDCAQVAEALHIEASRRAFWGGEA